MKGDTFFCLQAMGDLGEPIWFHTGDRDLAVHLLRSKMLTEGKTLSEVGNRNRVQNGGAGAHSPHEQFPGGNPG